MNISHPATRYMQSYVPVQSYGELLRLFLVCHIYRRDRDRRVWRSGKARDGAVQGFAVGTRKIDNDAYKEQRDDE
jgi:hypothetical protein